MLRCTNLMRSCRHKAFWCNKMTAGALEVVAGEGCRHAADVQPAVAVLAAGNCSDISLRPAHLELVNWSDRKSVCGAVAKLAAVEADRPGTCRRGGHLCVVEGHQGALGKRREGVRRLRGPAWSVHKDATAGARRRAGRARRHMASQQFQSVIHTASSGPAIKQGLVEGPGRGRTERRGWRRPRSGSRPRVLGALCFFERTSCVKR